MLVIRTYVNGEWIPFDGGWDTFEEAWKRLIEYEAQYPARIFSIRVPTQP